MRSLNCDMSDIWWEPREIIPDRPQLEFLIEYIELLKAGGWPPKPKVYGENEPNIPNIAIIVGRKRKGSRRPALVPLQWAIEIDSRLEETGRDGDLVMLRYHNNMLEDKIARLMNCDVGEIIHRINRAMRYMSGFGRKRISYQEFISHRRRKRRTSKLNATMK